MHRMLIGDLLADGRAAIDKFLNLGLGRGNEREEYLLLHTV